MVLKPPYGVSESQHSDHHPMKKPLASLGAS